MCTWDGTLSWREAGDTMARIASWATEHAISRLLVKVIFEDDDPRAANFFAAISNPTTINRGERLQRQSSNGAYIEAAITRRLEQG